jgi:isopenicillin N synthase-like dioxygenase
MMNVPLVDISGFKTGSYPERSRIAARIDQAAREVGFMQITGHGVPDGVVRGLGDAIDAFFGLPLAEKAKWRAPSPDINRGYTGSLDERLSYSLGVASAADLFEAFNIGAPASAFPGVAVDPAHYPENIWPATVPAFRTLVETWFAHAGGVARDLTRIFELALGLADGYFAAYQSHSVDVLRMNHYGMPPGVTRVEKDQMGMGAHTDFGIVTVLWADPVTPGLQILDKLGGWHDVVPAPGALLVNLGDLLARWTNDRWISTMHRVLPPVDANGQVKRRRSAAYFHDGNADALITCLPSCTDADHPPLYAPVSVADHIAAKLGGSRGLELNAGGEREAARLNAARSAVP